MWCSAKVHFKMMRDVKRAYLLSYLDEYSFRKNNDLTKVGSLEAILTSIADQYLVGDLLEFEKLSSNENDGLDIEKLNEDIGHAQYQADPLLDGDIPDLVYPTRASFEFSDLITSGSEATLVTEENEAAALEVNKPEAKKQAHNYSFVVSVKHFEIAD